MVTLLKSIVVPVTATVFPAASLVLILPPNETLVAPVIAIVLMLPPAPIVPLVVTVLVPPPEEVIVMSSPKLPAIAPGVIAPPAEVSVVLAPKAIAPKVIASLLLTIEPNSVTVPVVPSLIPPLKVSVSFGESPSCNVPSLLGVKVVAIVEPLPVNARLATVLSTSSALTSTSPEKVAVPPTLSSASVAILLIAPLAVISAPATLFPVSMAKFWPLPVTVPMVMSPLLFVASVSIVTGLANVTAPRTIGLVDVFMLPFNVTVPPTDIVVSPPL